MRRRARSQNIQSSGSINNSYKGVVKRTYCGHAEVSGEPGERVYNLHGLGGRRSPCLKTSNLKTGDSARSP